MSRLDDVRKALAEFFEHAEWTGPFSWPDELLREFEDAVREDERRKRRE